MIITPTFLHLLANLLVNMAAAWLAAAFILPATTRPRTKFDNGLLAANITFGLASFGIAFIIENSLI